MRSSLARRIARLSFAAPLILALITPGLSRAQSGGDSIICREQCGENNDSCQRICLSDRSRLALPPVPMRPMPRPPTLYGAIAVETRSLITGFGRGAASRADAERRALALCRRGGGTASGCQIAVWAHNSCLALTTSREPPGQANVWGYAYSDDGWVSRRNATRACVKAGGSRCTVAVSFCTG